MLNVVTTLCVRPSKESYGCRGRGLLLLQGGWANAGPMNQRAWDRSGEASAALLSAVESHGTSVLSNPQMLTNLFKDLLPDSPREAFVLVTAEDGDVAGMLRQRIGQKLDPTAAVRLTAP